ncbi:anti-sigma regulatory factor [Actinoplanes sp. L3-i22]|uniref:ATP-binding protein n=1 Tax=Actinoplanes sp. L3-i22 TaxID=2836373 RepID=UPI001C74F6B4|nr:ATP-binding protein [Actinoplanes sp. L3-i22]BCY09941.1 hypothetical protein L3i22_050290 [Actinoplanes sp. L3-i22]
MNVPFLVVDTPQVSCVSESGDAATQVVVRGRWDGALRQETSRVLRACVAEAPLVVLVDLAQLQDPFGESASTWHIAGRFAVEAGRQVTLVLCAAPPAVRRRMSTGGGDHVLVLADSVDAARADEPVLTGGVRQRHMTLPAQHAACVLARTMAGGACLAFGAAHLADPARLIVSELVANALQHAGTEVDVWVSLRGPVVHLAVQDGNPELPRVLEAAPERGAALPRSGLGLRAVSAAATAWGALPSRRGKVVWATLAIRGTT